MEDFTQMGDMHLEAEEAEDLEERIHQIGYFLEGERVRMAAVVELKLLDLRAAPALASSSSHGKEG